MINRYAHARYRIIHAAMAQAYANARMLGYSATDAGAEAEMVYEFIRNIAQEM